MTDIGYCIPTEIGRELVGKDGQTVVRKGKICDFSDPYWRVEYPDGDWEELSRKEVRKAVLLAHQPPV